VYRTLEFKSEYPDEWQFDQEDNPIGPGSRELADEIAARLAEYASVISSVEQHSYYGWGFETRYENCTFYQVLNPADGDCYFTIQCLGYWLRKLLFKKPRQTFGRYCDVVDQALRRIPQISDLKWGDFRS